MYYLSYLRHPGIFAILAVNLACAPSEIESDVTERLIDGTQSYERPEIGRLHLSDGSLCTGSLIAANVVITAAHCVSYRTSAPQESESHGYFAIDRRGRSTSWYEIDATRSFGAQPGTYDIALLKLRTNVPEDIASPTTLAFGPTGRGSEITVFGYGCTERARQTGSGTKRSFQSKYDETYNLCPGDSGGPVVLGSDGPLLLINSAYYTGSGKDVFAEPYRITEELDQQIEAWAPPRMIESPPITPPACIGGARHQESADIASQTQGQICSDRDSWFRVELQSGDTINVKVEFLHAEGDIDVSFHDPRLRRRTMSQGVEDIESVEYRAYGAGTYYIRVYGYDGAQNFASINMNIVR